MSTDIIRWNSGEQDYQAGALHLYLAICLPLMAATFVVWGAFQIFERRKESKENEKAKTDSISA